jgi:hypothetical protein
MRLGEETASTSASSTVEPRAAGDLNETLIATDQWTDSMVAEAGIPVVDVPFVTVGGGIGSFVTVDLLRVCGVPPHAIRVLTPTEYPWQTYEYLTRNSQIPLQERIRSDSSSMPGNIWGFPGYALREAWRERTLAPLWSVLTEPILCNYWTPRAGTVFTDMKREADRMGWWSMTTKGQVRMIRRRAGGGYFTILTPPPGQAATRRVAFRSTHAHLAIGYPGLKFLDDLQDYRARTGDQHHVVNAYEPHEYVYEELVRKPGTVVIRGSGIVASRVLQRLIDDRDRTGAQTTILHLFRTYVSRAQGTSILARRSGANGWAHQGFNYPKSAWGGQHWERCRRLEGPDRLRFYQEIGGTNTPKRKLWLRQLARGRAEGWYRAHIGQVVEVTPGADSTVVTKIRDPAVGSMLEVGANFVIDCTGLEADIREHRVLADLLDHSGARRNPLGRLDVERTFEVRGTASPPGRLYATGSMTLGGYFCGVDTFLGLQLAAVDLVDDLAAQGFCPRIGVSRSVREWWKWARNRPI